MAITSILAFPSSFYWVRFLMPALHKHLKKQHSKCLLPGTQLYTWKGTNFQKIARNSSVPGPQASWGMSPWAGLLQKPVYIVVHIGGTEQHPPPFLPALPQWHSDRGFALLPCCAGALPCGLLGLPASLEELRRGWRIRQEHPVA